MSEPIGARDRGGERREGETTFVSGLLGIAYVLLMAVGVGIVGFVMALVVSWIY